jgi:hypothetical protein
MPVDILRRVILLRIDIYAQTQRRQGRRMKGRLERALEDADEWA